MTLIRQLAWPLASWALSGLGVIWLATRPSPWAAWRPATCMPDICFCEAIRDSWVRQPVNAISSLAFLAVAVFVVRVERRPSEPASRLHPLKSGWVYPAIYGIALALIGLGSAFYHASLTFVGQTADVLGMYLLGTFILIYNSHRLSPLSPAKAMTTYLIGNAALLVLLVQMPALRRYAFAGIILSALALEWRIRRGRRVAARTALLYSAIGLMAVAFAVWVLDITGVACDPQSFLQGHGVWHVLGATSALLLYVFYISEDPPTGTVPWAG